MKKQVALLFFLWLAPFALIAQTTEQFNTYVNTLPPAVTAGSLDQFYVRQGGVSKQMPLSVLLNGVAFWTNTPAVVANHCAAWSAAGTLKDAGGICNTGTVTSVGITVPTGLSISGCPVTLSGICAITWSGTIPNSSVPPPTASALGGVEATTCAGSQFVNSVSTAGAIGCATPAGGGNVSTAGGTVTDCAVWLTSTSLGSASCSGSSGGNIMTAFNVLNYGATGTGTHDDSAGVAAAIAAAYANGGGTVFFPCGTYWNGTNPSGIIVLEATGSNPPYQNITFQGGGRDCTILEGGNSIVTVAMQMTGGFTNWDTLNTVYAASTTSLGGNTVTTTTHSQAGNFSAGNIILISGTLNGGQTGGAPTTDFWYPSWFTTVVSANATSGVITVAESIPLRPQDVAFVQKIINMPNHIVFKDMTVGCTAATVNGQPNCGITDALGMFGCDYCVVENVKTIPGAGPGGIFFDNVRHSGCRACVMANGSQPIELFGASNSYIEGSWLSNSGILVDGGSTDNMVINNTLNGNNYCTSPGVCAFGNMLSLSDYTQRTTVMGNTILGLASGGFFGIGEAGSPDPNRNNVVVGNSILGIDTTSTIGLSLNHSVAMGNVLTNLQLGVFAGGTGGGSIQGNIFNGVANPLQNSFQVGAQPYRFLQAQGIRNMAAGTATPSAPDAGFYELFQSGAQNITDLTGGSVGDVVKILVGDSNTTFKNAAGAGGTQLHMKGAADYNPPGGTDPIIMTFILTPFGWYEQSRTQ